MESKFKVVEWTPSKFWLVAVTGKDGSYTPVLELHKEGDGTNPTYNNQLFQSAKLLADRGIDAVNNPHAMIGRECKCGSCFCCAANEIVTLARKIKF